MNFYKTYFIFQCVFIGIFLGLLYGSIRNLSDSICLGKYIDDRTIVCNLVDFKNIIIVTIILILICLSIGLLIAVKLENEVNK